MRWDLLRMGLRWMMAAIFVGCAFFFATRNAIKGAEAAGSPFGAAYSLLVAMGLLMIGVCFIAPDMVRWLTAPVRHFFDDLVYPRDCLTKAPPDYTLARYYRKHLRYAEALYWYHRLLRAHPQELQAYLEGIMTAFESGDAALAAKLRRKGLRKLREETARQEVERVYGTLLEATTG